MTKNIFKKLNKVAHDSKDEDIDETLGLRRDLGDILVSLSHCSGASMLYQMVFRG